MSKLAWKGLVILAPVLFALYLLYPTLAWYQLPAEERTAREFERDPIMTKILNADN